MRAFERGQFFVRAKPLLAILVILPGTFGAQLSAGSSLAEQFAQRGYAPIELRRTGDNHLFQFGRLNGRKLSCLVDTGWSFTTLQADSRHPGNTLESLKLDRTTFTNQPARAENMVFNGQRAAFDLVLGLDFLRRNFAVLDCGRRRLFTRPEALADEPQSDIETALRRAGYRELELRLRTPPALTLTARVNGEPIEMLLDSGAAWSCVDHRQCERLGLKPLASAARITGAGATGRRNVAVAEVKSLQLGELNLKHTTVALFDLADWGFAAPDQALNDVQGILGGELLAATGAVIDCHRLKVWLLPPGRK